MELETNMKNEYSNRQLTEILSYDAIEIFAVDVFHRIHMAIYISNYYCTRLVPNNLWYIYSNILNNDNVLKCV